MHRFPSWATFVAGIAVAGSTSPALAQDSPFVVVLDVARVFKEHQGFKQSMEAMKQEVEAVDAEVRRKRELIKADAKKIRDLQPGSAEHQALETRVAKATTELQLEMNLKRKQIMKREARLYYDTYQHVSQTVAKFAQRNGVHLVLRFNSQKMKPDDRASIMKGVHNQIVFQRNLNITDLIIQEVNRDVSATGPHGGGIPPR